MRHCGTRHTSWSQARVRCSRALSIMRWPSDTAQHLHGRNLREADTTPRSAVEAVELLLQLVRLVGGVVLGRVPACQGSELAG